VEVRGLWGTAVRPPVDDVNGDFSSGSLEDDIVDDVNVEVSEVPVGPGPQASLAQGLWGREFVSQTQSAVPISAVRPPVDDVNVEVSEVPAGPGPQASLAQGLWGVELAQSAVPISALRESVKQIPIIESCPQMNCCI